MNLAAIPLPSWWVASIIANVAIIYIEYVNRATSGGWTEALPLTVGPIILAQFMLFLAFNGAPHWLAGWGFFTIGNSIMRIIAVYFFASAVGSWSFVSLGIATMLAGGLILKLGLK